jgi:DNA-binding MarR family transcriptional regulator
MASEAELTTWVRELEKLARALGQTGPDEVCCEGLTTRQCSILRTLVDRQGARLSDLAAESTITPSAMTRALDRLEAQNLVRRVRGKGEDGRAATVEITERGREVRQRIDQLMIARTWQIVDAVPEPLRPQILACLRVLNQALGPEGCCQLSGQWPDVAVSCKVDVPQKEKTQCP